MQCVWDTLEKKRTRKIYSYQYFAHSFGRNVTQDLLAIFLKELKKQFINSDIYFSNIPDKKIPEIYMYTNDKRKETKPTKDFLTTLVQPYSYMCAWKRCHGEDGSKKSIIFLDNFQGETTIAWDNFWYRKPNIFYKGDICNALISTADILAGVVDYYLIDESFYHKSVNSILTDKLKLNGKSFIIGSKELRCIVPTSRIQINTTRFLKHPIFFFINEDKPRLLDKKEAKHQIDFSPMMDIITNIAYENNGAVKFYDEITDYKFLKNEDRIIYNGERGKALAENLQAQGYTNKTFYYPHETIE